jgi:hypothetical protein
MHETSVEVASLLRRLAEAMEESKSVAVQDSQGHPYDVIIYGEPRTDGTWEGRLEFVPLSATLSTRRTARETTQPDRASLEYWATGLEPLYLTGAFERAA